MPCCPPRWHPWRRWNYVPSHPTLLTSPRHSTQQTTVQSTWDIRGNIFITSKYYFRQSKNKMATILHHSRRQLRLPSVVLEVVALLPRTCSNGSLRPASLSLACLKLSSAASSSCPSHRKCCSRSVSSRNVVKNVYYLVVFLESGSYPIYWKLASWFCTIFFLGTSWMAFIINTVIHFWHW